MFICKPQINLITHFFLEILHFKESCNVIGQKHGQLLQSNSFSRHRVCDEKSRIKELKEFSFCIAFREKNDNIF